MTISRRTLLGTATPPPPLPLVRSARARRADHQDRRAERQSGPYTNTGGPTSVVCCQAGAGGFRRLRQGLNVEVISADHQNKPDLAVSIARQWFDRDGVDMLLDVPTSSVALAVQSVVRGEEQGLPQFRRRDVRPDRRAVLAELHPLDLRHLHAGEVDRRRDGEGRRRFLVLPHRRLRVRQAAAGRHHRASSRPPAARCWAASPIRSPAPPISPPSWCRRSRAAPRCSACAMPAPTR